jgi:hypothetical protein
MIEITGNRGCALRLVGVLLLGSLCMIVLAPSASADTTYTYTGNPFTFFCALPSCIAGTPEVTGFHISASFTVASPLPDNLPSGTQITPLSMFITDGVFTLTELSVTPSPADPDILVGTGPTGQIDRWLFWEASQFGVGGQLSTCGPTFCGELSDFSNTIRGLSYNTNDPGTWTTSTTPEPSSLMLLGTGLVGLAMGLRRKRLGLR